MSKISNIIKEAFKIIAPSWPLQNLISVNHLKGLEDLPFEEALMKAALSFELGELPEFMESVNRETIKWLQAFLDKGQATVVMPLRNLGLYKSWSKLVLHDTKIHRNKCDNLNLIKQLPENPEEAINLYLNLLKIDECEQKQFLTLLLTTLPGWSSYIKYLTEWADDKNNYPISQADYLAIRIVTAFLLYPEAKSLLILRNKNIEACKNQKTTFSKILENEKAYQIPLLKSISSQKLRKDSMVDAQFIFCIDVRSEPFRRALESSGNYKTYGFAGFFGIPIILNDKINNETFSSCPVLIKPQNQITKYFLYNKKDYLKELRTLYQALKYNFTTPFALVEIIGIFSGLYTALRSFLPSLQYKIKNFFKNDDTTFNIQNIDFNQQLVYAENILKIIGIGKFFAPIIVICGHGSYTENNPFANSLDCGACGGRSGEDNARIMSIILNDKKIRRALSKKDINIPEETIFIAAKHNTSTDEVTLYNSEKNPKVDKIKLSLEKARNFNSAFRLKYLDQCTIHSKNTSSQVEKRAADWAQVRPEWGLARNAAFIVGDIDITLIPNLEGRCFLHSYDYLQDPVGESLELILTAPMIVAQWINAQYLFSTMNNIAYGAGSKVTHNITGKIGIMQGNASDLMTGLPMQSVYLSYKQAYHLIQRLITVVVAPRELIMKIINKQEMLQKLFRNGWVQISCIEPESREIFLLSRELTWEKIS